MNSSNIKFMACHAVATAWALTPWTAVAADIPESVSPLAQFTVESTRIARSYGTYDWSYSTSDNLFEGWSKPRPLVPHGGTGSVFQDKHGRWWAAVFGSDTTAPLPQSVGFVPLIIEERDGDVHIRVADQFPTGMDMSKNNWPSSQSER